MNVEDTVRRLIWHYPTLFPNRIHVLHHLFYVGGNGYEWENGELVTVFGDDRSDQDAYWDTEQYPLMGEEFVADYNGYVDKVRAEIDRRSQDLTWDIDTDRSPTGKRHPYPKSQFRVPMVDDLPADVQPDWKRAANEARMMIEPLYESRGDMAQAIHRRTHAK